MTAQHTPGPWTVGTEGPWTDNIFGPDRRLIADTFKGLPETSANAQLMAAAPQLLAALIDIMDSSADVQMTFDRDSEQHDMMTCPCKFCALNRSFKLAEDAIAKAGGRQ